MYRTGIACLILLGILWQANGQMSRPVAEYLARMPIHCIGNEYPNKANHTAETEADSKLLPHELHPSFYGCLDWHSSVHGHWLLVKILKERYIGPVPDGTGTSIPDSIVSILDRSFLASNIAEEAAYFTKYKSANTFERTYGWAWLLKLDQELQSWDHPLGRKWHEALRPLTAVIVSTWKSFLPKQTYPNRTGVHPNTAFGLVFALDWARATGDTAFEHAIIIKARSFYLDNKNYPAYIEPDGTDFLSPSLEAADLMSRILPAKAFVSWINAYFDPRGIARITQMPVVSDRTDMQIVHLDGLSLSRAWCMKGISQKLPNGHPWKKLFRDTAGSFLETTLPHVTSGNYGGDHWLASFALYALTLGQPEIKSQ